MAFIFPDFNETSEFTAANGVAYEWHVDEGKWVVKHFTSGNPANIGSEPPPNTIDGTLWYSTLNNLLHVQVTEADTVSWKPTGSATDLTSIESRLTELETKESNSVRIDSVPPGDNLEEGNIWIDSNTYNAYVYTGVEWVQITTSVA